eukprot:1332414-Amphidinium_carterae.1
MEAQTKYPAQTLLHSVAEAHISTSRPKGCHFMDTRTEKLKAWRQGSSADLPESCASTGLTSYVKR